MGTLSQQNFDFGEWWVSNYECTGVHVRLHVRKNDTEVIVRRNVMSEMGGGKRREKEKKEPDQNAIINACMQARSRFFHARKKKVRALAGPNDPYLACSLDRHKELSPTTHDEYPTDEQPDTSDDVHVARKLVRCENLRAQEA